MEEFVEKIQEQRNTNFKVTKIPVWALKKFKKLCKEEYGDIYFVGIIQLMKIKEQYEQLLAGLNSKSKPRIKTFGDDELKTEERDVKVS